MDDAGWGGAPAGPGARGLPASGYPHEVRAEIVRRAAAGESLRAICADEGMPHRTLIRRWVRQWPEFGRELAAAAKAVRLRRRRADLARAMAPKDFRGRLITYTPAIGAEICRRLSEGETLIAICRGEGAPKYATVLRWLRVLPEFADAYAEARQLAADYLFDEAREVALASRPATVWVDRLKFDVIRWQAARIAPRKYAEKVLNTEEIATLRAIREGRENGPAPFTVILKRYSEVTEEELRRSDEGEP